MRRHRFILPKLKPILRLLFALIFFASSPVLFAQYREVYKGFTDGHDINGMSFLSPSTGYIAFSSSIGFTRDSGKTFTQYKPDYTNTNYNGYSVNLTFGFYAQGVKMFSVDSVFAYGHFGWEPSILFSADGGQHWKLVYHRPLNITVALSDGVTDMVFPGNGSQGFAVHDEEILTTADRGQSWSTAVSVPQGQMRKLSFPSLSTGFAIGGTKLFRTTNGGLTWNNLNVPSKPVSSQYNNVSFPSLATGFISDYSNGIIYKTTDLGYTWLAANDYHVEAVKGTDLHFTNDSTGYITAEYGYEVYKTTDGGGIWERCKRSPEGYQYLYYGMNSLFFYNESIGWAGGDLDYLLLTTDGASLTHPAALFSIDTSGIQKTRTVQLINHSKKEYQYQWYKNDSLISTDYNTFYHYNYPAYSDDIKLVVTNSSGDKDSSEQRQSYEIKPLPQIFSFTPKTAATGSIITITGDDLNLATTVRFGGVPADSFLLSNNYKIMYAFVGKGASGSVSVESLDGVNALDGFTFLPAVTGIPPVVTSFSPPSGPIGTVVTITGNNFNTSTAGNVVYFGGALASVLSATATKLTCAVPVSPTFRNISVLNTATHLTGFSSRPFNVTFADSSSNLTSHSFEDTVAAPFGGDYNSVNAVTAADVDGDGKTDIVSSEVYNGFGTVVYRNQSTKGDIAFAKPVALFNTPGLQLGLTEMTDMDGDGKPDFVVATNEGNIVIARNTSTPGNISSDTAATFPEYDNWATQELATADFDGDGRPDVAAANFSPVPLAVFRNTSLPGHLSFTASRNFVSKDSATFGGGIAAGDLDGDGKADLVTVSENLYSSDLGSVSVFKNTSTTGNISFMPISDFVITNIEVVARGIRIYDANNDGKADIVVLENGIFTVFKNTSANGVMSFEKQPQNNSARNEPINRGLYIDNIDGDGKPDVITASTVGFVNIAKNLSLADSISFDKAVDYSAEAWQMTGADFNGDGRQDIAESNNSVWFGHILILKNTAGKTLSASTCTSGYTFFEADITGTSYQWQQDTGKGFTNIIDNNRLNNATTSSLSIYQPLISWNGSRYRCLSDGHISSTFILTVRPVVLPTVFLTVSDSVACSNAPVLFTAHSTNTYSIERYTWFINGKQVASSESNTYYGGFSDGDEVKVTLLTDDSCYAQYTDTSNTIRMKIRGTAPDVSVTASSYVLCPRSNVTYTATATGSLDNPVYHWLVNGKASGSNNPVFTTNVLRDGDTVQMKVTAASVCSVNTDFYSVPIPVIVQQPAVPLVSITSSGNNICPGNSVTFSAITINSYQSSFQWQVNGINTGTGPYFVSAGLHNNDNVQVLVSDSAICIGDTTIASNIISMKVNLVTANAGIDKTICQNGAAVIGADAVAGYSYSWVSVPTGFVSASSSAQVTPAADTKYILTATAGNCSSGDTVSVTLAPVFSVTGLSPVPLTVCPGDKVAIGIPAQAGYSYYWQSNPAGFTSDESNPSISPSVSTVYSLTLTKTATGCGAQAQVTVSPVSCIIESHIYPNPATDAIVVATTIPDLTNVVFELFDSRGKSLLMQKLSTPTTAIRVSGFSAGLYKFVIWQDGLRKGEGQFLIQR